MEEGVLINKGRWLTMAVLMLTVSILAGGYWIGYSLMNRAQPAYSLAPVQSLKGLMTEKETAEYLNLSPETFSALLSFQEKQRTGLKNFDTYRFIPYIQMDGVRLFSRDQVNKWIEYNSINWTAISTR